MITNITVENGDNNTKVAIKNCHPFIRPVIHLNDEHVETEKNLDLIMNLYNLIEHSDNYSDTTASLYYYKRPEQVFSNDGTAGDITTNSSEFKYQFSLLDSIRSTGIAANVNPDVANAHRLSKNVKLFVPLKYLSNFIPLIELLLINTKLYVELNWTKHSVMSTVIGATTLHINKTELYVPVVTLNTVNTKKLSNMLKEGFKRSVVWNESKSKLQRVVSGKSEH